MPYDVSRETREQDEYILRPISVRLLDHRAPSSQAKILLFVSEHVMACPCRAVARAPDTQESGTEAFGLSNLNPEDFAVG